MIKEILEFIGRLGIVGFILVFAVVLGDIQSPFPDVVGTAIALASAMWIVLPIYNLKKKEDKEIYEMKAKVSRFNSLCAQP